MFFFLFYFTITESGAVILCVWFEQTASLDFVARVLFTLLGETHVSGAATKVVSLLTFAQRSFFSLSGLFLFADRTRFTCNCAQVQQKSPCSPMFFARLPNFVLPVCSVTFGLHFQHVPCHVLAVPVFVLSQQEGAD